MLQQNAILIMNKFCKIESKNTKKPSEEIFVLQKFGLDEKVYSQSAFRSQNFIAQLQIEGAHIIKLHSTVLGKNVQNKVSPYNFASLPPTPLIFKLETC